MFRGLKAIIYKEVIQVRRDPATKFIFAIPIIQLIVFGYALDTDVRKIPTVVFDADRRSASREFLTKFESTDVFRIVGEVDEASGVVDAIVQGRAQVGILLPPDFSDNLVNHRRAQVQVLIDGSNNTVAQQALSASNGIAMDVSLARLGEQVRSNLAIDLRPRVLFNEDMRSEAFFVPGLVGIILQLTTVFLTAFSIVRERELGTMEQLMATPVSRWALMLGKLTPFIVIGFVETCVVLALMVYVFGVPIAGDKAVLLALSALFLVPCLGLGILISTVAKNQSEALQMTLLIMLPSILLSGFFFPRISMPTPIYAISFLIPATYYIEILRGIILRGATAGQLWFPTAMLLLFSVVIFLASTLRFQKRID